MNVVSILALALGIILEKVTSFGRSIAPIAGTALIAAGGWVIGDSNAYWITSPRLGAAHSRFR